jgi:hypothetical protein
MMANITDRLRISPVPLLLVYGNVLCALLLLIAIVLGRQGMPWISLPIGLVGLLGPAFSLVIAVEQSAEGDSSFTRFIFTLVLLHLIITPVGTYLIHRVAFGPAPVDMIIQVFFVWWAVCFFVAECVAWMKRQPTVLYTFSLSHKIWRELVWISALFCIVMVANFVIYPLLPEGDGYFYLMKIQERITNPLTFVEETRVGFFVFTHLLSQVSHSDPYWIFKIVLPMLHIFAIFAVYSLTRLRITDSRYRVLFALAPLYFPVILQESLISRPQSLFLISFLPFMSVLADVVTRGRSMRAVYWLLVLLVISGVGIKIHTLFGLLPVAVGIGLIVYLRHEIAKRPLDAFVIGLGIIALAYPGIVNSRLIPDLQQLARLIVGAFSKGVFEWWFIDYYRNVDGIEVGWPGITAAFYYGYNMGLFLIPLLFFALIAVFRDRSLLRFRLQGSAITFLVLFFLFIAEIAPRFSLAYLPDRAWLFLALLSAALLPALAYLGAMRWRAWGFALLVAAGVLSVGVGSGITYAKQGWVTPAEVAAAKYLQGNVPQDAIIIGPSSMQVMVRYYAKREYDHGRPNLFLQPEQYQLDDYIREDRNAYQRVIDTTKSNRSSLRYRLNEVAGAVIRSDITDDQLMQYLDSTAALVHSADSYIAPPADKLDIFMPGNRSIYYVYNREKFSSLYGQRSWWRTSNFYGANVAALSQMYPVIYDQNGTMIWEVKK